MSHRGRAVSHKHRPRPEAFDGAVHVGKCPRCGKLMFASRQVAKKAGRQVQRAGVAVTRVYRCGDYWHWTTQDTATATMHRERKAS